MMVYDLRKIQACQQAFRYDRFWAGLLLVISVIVSTTFIFIDVAIIVIVYAKLCY